MRHMYWHKGSVKELEMKCKALCRCKADRIGQFVSLYSEQSGHLNLIFRQITINILYQVQGEYDSVLQQQQQLYIPGIIIGLGPGGPGPIKGIGAGIGPPIGAAGIAPGGPGIGPGTGPGLFCGTAPALNAAAVIKKL